MVADSHTNRAADSMPTRSAGRHSDSAFYLPTLLGAGFCSFSRVLSIVRVGAQIVIFQFDLVLSCPAERSEASMI